MISDETALELAIGLEIIAFVLGWAGARYRAKTRTAALAYAAFGPLVAMIVQMFGDQIGAIGAVFFVPIVYVFAIVGRRDIQG